jgi:hypothetical protein
MWIYYRYLSHSFHYKSVQKCLRKCWQLEKKLVRTIKMHWTSITACLQESANPKIIKQASKQAINQSSVVASVIELGTANSRTWTLDLRTNCCPGVPLEWMTSGPCFGRTSGPCFGHDYRYRFDPSLKTRFSFMYTPHVSEGWNFL